MNYYLKTLLISAFIGFINILIYFVILDVSIVHNSSIIPKELGVIVLILIAIPIQFLILLVVGYFFDRSDNSIFITSILCILTCSLILWFTSSHDRALFDNQQIYNQTEKYKYNQGISVPEGYPIKLLSGSNFSLAVKSNRNPSTLLETDKVYYKQWGLSESTVKSESAGKAAVPNSLNLYWYSYVENKYYELNTEIDEEKISAYFRKGFVRDNKGKLTNAESVNGKYNDLFAGIAPGGDVVLWIGGVNQTDELAVFKANEISVNKIREEDIVNEEARKKVLNDTCTCVDNYQFRKIINNNKPIPFGIWTNKYRQKYNWKILVNDFGQGKSAYNLSFFNGEDFAIYNEDILKLNYLKLVTPNYIIFTFIKNEQKYRAFIEFEADEIFSHFEKLTENNKEEPLDFVINISSDLTEMSVQLVSKDTSLNFEKLKTASIRIR
ncbi:DUF2931 family protein [Cellulophaga sp. E16_2]|uniref:DUF2931 family protein n=1 Tax=Cellulophaga sp. E16_2 TaxID=2789297 RepID=UPI001A9317C4|nr:DUF2931 family protein [Cellulophaga sp. E16_2]MBO0590492.1 DUF2931 family protein [Cellulophaga sp. E16_2]